MAVTRVSPGDPHSIRSVTERRQNKLGTHPGRARNTDDPEIGRVLKTAHTSQIGRTITAPVTQKTRDLRLPLCHLLLLIEWFAKNLSRI